jgi:hypothetical protein
MRLALMQRFAKQDRAAKSPSGANSASIPVATTLKTVAAHATSIA